MVRRLPQILINVPVTDRLRVAESDEVAEAVNAVEAELGDSGRVLLRPSGTEQLVRVMVEAPTQEQADEVAERLAEVVAAVHRDARGRGGSGRDRGVDRGSSRTAVAPGRVAPRGRQCRPEGPARSDAGAPRDR